MPELMLPGRVGSGWSIESGRTSAHPLRQDGEDKQRRGRVEAQEQRHLGATAVEYGLVVALLIVGILVLAATVGRQVFNLYSTVPVF